jgi:NAD(P)-dependent dehydrogenase (short-subunit alcohol dehydrogenase family)
MTSKTIIITGGNTGLGFETAKAIARDQNTLIVIACRSPDLGRAAVQNLESLGRRAAYLPLDLGEQASVRQFVKLFRQAEFPLLRGIVCNAGMQNVAVPQVTGEGYETTFAVNHLGHYLLVRLLLDDLAEDSSITFVSSGTHDPAQKTGVPNPVYKNAYEVAHDLEAGRNAGLRRYTTSKFCNILCAYELARRLKASGDARLNTVKVNAINPGIMPGTGLARTWPRPIQWASQIIMPLLRFVNDNVNTTQTSGEWAAALTTGPESAPGGRYFSNGEAIRSSEQSYDQSLQQELWISSAEMTGLPVELACRKDV